MDGKEMHGLMNSLIPVSPARKEETRPSLLLHSDEHHHVGYILDLELLVDEI